MGGGSDGGPPKVCPFRISRLDTADGCRTDMNLEVGNRMTSYLHLGREKSNGPFDYVVQNISLL
jgi:hypothetical protein